MNEIIANILSTLKSLVNIVHYTRERTARLEERVDFIENLLREHHIHSHECKVMDIARKNAQGRAYFHPQPCDCWLTLDQIPTDL